jgi:hypothetical protein
MRSSYVYLIFNCTTLLSVHTVKYEAIEWFLASEWEEGEVTFYRMHDGGMKGKHEPMTMLPWSELLE